jgi:prevent-host-death family protein
MVKRYTAQETREKLSDILGTVYYGKEPVIVEKRGRPVAVLISPEDFELLQQERERRFTVIDRIQERNADFDLEEVLGDVTAVVEDVRREQYAADRTTPPRRR